MKDRMEGRVRKKSKGSEQMTENKASGETKTESEWTGQRRKQHSGGRKRSRGPETGRVTFAVRADQFPVPSIIDVTSTVGCYLSGLTN